MADEAQNAFIEMILGMRIGGRYLVERVLGQGGMGLVVAARHPELEQDVAIKLMLPELASNTTLTARFLREARLAAKVKSPHFVRVFDVGRLDGGTPYIVMEMLHGKNLDEELKSHGPFSVEDAVDYVLQACAGLAELHAMGVVHRDLKPSNLFLAEAAGTSTLKVLDLGVSKERTGQGASLTSTGHMLGTVHYMSPEQIKESKTTDARTDVWALGVILHELLTDSLPYGGYQEAPGEVFGLVLHTDPRTIRSVKPDLPESIEQVVLACLRRDPADRYADVGSLAEALRPFASSTSLPRIAAVKKALATPPPVRSIEPTPGVVPIGERATALEGAGAARPTATAPTKAAPAAQERAATLAGQSKAARTNDPSVRPPASRRPIVIAASLGAAAGLAFVIGHQIARPTSSSDAPSASALASPAAVPSASPTVDAVPSASDTRLPPAAFTASASAAPPLVPASASHHVAGAAHPHASAIPSSHAPPAASSTPSILDSLDRK